MQNLDVSLYYLKKKIKYNGNVYQRVTTTDSLFYQTCRATNERCPISDYVKVDVVCTLIAEYILGTYMCCATPWAFCDDVVMPVFVKVDAHFILAHFDIKERLLVIYNSLSGATHRKTAIEAVQPLSILIPVYLGNTHFYESRTDSGFSQGPYSVLRSSPLDVVVVDNVSIQDD